MKGISTIVLLAACLLGPGAAAAVGAEPSPSPSPAPSPTPDVVDPPALAPVVTLSIEIDGPVSAEPGTQVELEVVVRNDGPDAADRWGVTVDAGNGVTIEAIDHEIACDDLTDCRDDPLEAGEGVVLAVRASVDADCVDEGGTEPVCRAEAGTCTLRLNLRLFAVCESHEPSPFDMAFEITSFDVHARAYAEAIDGNNVPEDEWEQPIPESDEAWDELFGWNVQESISMELVPGSIRMPDTGASPAVALAVALILLLGGVGVLRGGVVRNRDRPTT